MPIAYVPCPLVRTNQSEEEKIEVDCNALWILHRICTLLELQASIQGINEYLISRRLDEVLK